MVGVIATFVESRFVTGYCLAWFLAFRLCCSLVCVLTPDYEPLTLSVVRFFSLVAFFVGNVQVGLLPLICCCQVNLEVHLVSDVACVFVSDTFAHT